MRTLKKIMASFAAFLLMYAAFPVSNAKAVILTKELFFSEYVEGSSNNKALEIYNSNSVPVDLAAGNYQIKMYPNGSNTPGITINLTGTVPANDVYVVTHSLANASILAVADQLDGSGWYNGNDAVVLAHNTNAVDVIGQIGVNPGTEWGVGLTSTADNTLVRKCGINCGDSNGSNSFDPSIEWIGYATDNITNLGSHSFDDTAPTVLLTAMQASPTNTNPINMIATFSEDVTGFELTDIAVINGITSNLTPVTSSLYTFDIAPSDQGKITVDISSGAAYDICGNYSLAATQFSIIYDTVSPIVTDQIASYFQFSPKNVDGAKDATDVLYTLSEDADATVKVYEGATDLLVRDLATNLSKLAGANSDTWDGKDNTASYVADGYYNAEINAVDSAGNESLLKKYVYNILVDNSYPVIADMPDILTNTPVNLAGSATDNDLNINYKWEMVSGPLGATIDFDNDIDPATLVSADIDGDYLLKLSATDRAGNTAYKKIKLTWDTTVNPVTEHYAVTGDSFVDLHWKNPIDTDLVSVKIYRSIKEGELGEVLVELIKGETQYNDLLVLNGTTYYYTIRTTDTVGNYADATVLKVTPTAPTVSAPLTPVVASTYLPSGGPDNSGILGDQNTGGDVNSGATDENTGSTDDNAKGALPAVGIALLVLLALVGLYLLYLQNPEWFSWLFFWKKKTNKKKK